MKFKTKFKENLPLILILGIFIFFKVPQAFYHIGLSETSVPQEIRNDMKLNQKISFPPRLGPALVIYWASWCAPCKLEMNRLKNSVDSGKIPRSRIYAVNTFESADVVTDFLKNNDFPFIFMSPWKSDELFKIEATPSTVILIDGRVSSVSEGMSVSGIWKAEYLFRNFILQ